MLIIGAKGFAKEILEIIHQKGDINNVSFFDGINKDMDNLLFKKFPVLNTIDQAIIFFNKNGKEFTLGIGNPKLRYRLYEKFTKIGGVLTSLVHPLANIGSYEVMIGDGCNIFSGVNISNSVTLGKGCIVYYNSVITHDCVISDFVEISPSVNVLGRVKIGAFSHIGANSTILPDITIGDNVLVGAGSVVTKDVPNNTLVMGVPAKIIRALP